MSDKYVSLNSLKFSDSKGKFLVREDYFLVFENDELAEKFIQERHRYWSGLYGVDIMMAPNKNEVITELDIKKVFRHVCKYLGVSYPEIYAKTRKAEYIEARRFGIMVCIDYGQSQDDIARVLKKDHSLVAHHKKKFYDLCTVDKNYEAKFEKILDHVKKNIGGVYSEDGSGEKLKS